MANGGIIGPTNDPVINDLITTATSSQPGFAVEPGTSSVSVLVVAGGGQGGSSVGGGAGGGTPGQRNSPGQAAGAAGGSGVVIIRYVMSQTTDAKFYDIGGVVGGPA